MFETNEMMVSRVIGFKVCVGRTIAELNDNINQYYDFIKEDVSIEPYGGVEYLENEKLYTQSFQKIKVK